MPGPERALASWLARGVRIGAWLLVAIVLAGVVGIPLYVFPAHDEPREVDVAYVIGPPTDARMRVAEAMVAAGQADAVMVSVTEDPDVRRYHGRAAAVCDEGVLGPEVKVVCLMPDPFTTRGEARALADEAQAHGWRSAAVITFTPHISRTRVIMERCFAGNIAYLDPGQSLPKRVWAYQYVYQTLAFVKVAAMPSC
ncbi:hypothetical protein [Demequina pelophila]|uniref:hypothetical protein n=1 Tax=Demequina pelophila TaxID=1638984 RepID=UPI00078067A4|nr:hypothetical protein [Demequina pelophila]